MGTDNIKHYRVAKERGRFIDDEQGDAVVEATILFPIMTMIFAALVLISIYLPSRAVLQNATQYTATALATEISDTWLYFDDESMSYGWYTYEAQLTNVYAKLFENSSDAVSGRAEAIVRNVESRSVSSKAGELTVTGYLNNKIIYKEVIIEAARSYEMPVNLSFIGFPQRLTVQAGATAVVQNSDEFIRNIDIATDFVEYIIVEFGLTDIADSIGSFGKKVKDLLGW